jgi:hypothetical protein
MVGVGSVIGCCRSGRYIGVCGVAVEEAERAAAVLLVLLHRLACCCSRLGASCQNLR